MRKFGNHGYGYNLLGWINSREVNKEVKRLKEEGYMVRKIKTPRTRSRDSGFNIYIWRK